MLKQIVLRFIDYLWSNMESKDIENLSQRFVKGVALSDDHADVRIVLEDGEIR